jgi:superfamily I DNA/RNA helicase
MPQAINITDENIAYAEGIILPMGKIFDKNERSPFIKNLETLDLQAVPGSGKTTALLAKLLILEKNLPFDDGAGILVISHTNAAIDEIKNKIQRHCPKLFSYPNFVGTIQSFVDKFLAIPCSHNLLNAKISWIDNEKYEEELLRKYQRIAWSTEYDKPASWFWGRHIERANQEAKNCSKTPKQICLELIEKEVKSLYFDFNDNTIKLVDTDEVLLRTPTNKKYIGLKAIIQEVIEAGILSYDYAYSLSEYYLNKIPIVTSILQERFKYVFVDEMQDMDKKQYDILERLFYDNGRSISKYQRIGDKNQAIYNSVKAFDVWNDRPTVLKLSRSQRLSENIAKVVTKFALHSEPGFAINGLNPANIKPHILLYQNNSIENVIPFFSQLVNQLRENGQLINFGKYRIKAIAWNTAWKNQVDIENMDKLRLTDFYKTYTKNEPSHKINFDNLKSYIVFYDKNNPTSIRKNILHAILKILRYETIYDNTGNTFTEKRFLEHLKNLNHEEYEILKLHLYTWSIGIIQGNNDTICKEIRNYIPYLLSLLTAHGITKSVDFINSDAINPPIPNPGNQHESTNKYSTEYFDVEIGSVHAAKGQTHCATLYLESYYNKNYESLTLCNSFLNQNTAEIISGLNAEIEDLKSQVVKLGGGRGTQAKEKEINSCQAKIELLSQSTKMVYVGLSRPTDFLCFAIHKERFDKHLTSINSEEWEIVEVPE